MTTTTRSEWRAAWREARRPPYEPFDEPTWAEALAEDLLALRDNESDPLHPGVPRGRRIVSAFCRRTGERQGCSGFADCPPPRRTIGYDVTPGLHRDREGLLAYAILPGWWR